MNRTHRNVIMSLIASLALSAPLMASEDLDKLMAELDQARVSLNSHRDNVQLLEGEITAIRKLITQLKADFAETGDPRIKADLAWAVSDLARHQIRLADERAAVLEWSEVVQRLMQEIARVEEAEDAGETDEK